MPHRLKLNMVPWIAMISALVGCPQEAPKIPKKEPMETTVPIAESDPRPIGRVINVTVRTGYRSLIVEWERANGADGYKVQWKFGANTTFNIIVVDEGDTVTTDIDIPETIAGTEYAVRVIATKEGSVDGMPSEVVTGRLGCFDTYGKYTDGNFAGKDLSGHNLSLHNLSGSNFTGTDLSGADLSGACGESVDFQEANLSNADLSDATFAIEPGSNAPEIRSGHGTVPTHAW